jgi:Domain of unknown function (DUF4332)
MSLLFNILFAWKCKNTHHKLALDALQHLACDNAEKWRNAFLTNIDPYLDGSKAPDDKFKDFKNHVLHVRDGYWGGATTEARKWYEATVEALKSGSFTKAAYSAGVLSHYVTDPIQPYHTGQSPEETVVHRAAEWSIACSYDELTNLLRNNLGGYPQVHLPEGPDWLTEFLRQAARNANSHYERCIDHYSIKVGVKTPALGLDPEMKHCIAGLLGLAAVGFARILDRAIEQSQAKPPFSAPSVMGALAALTVPIFYVTKRMANASERATVLAIYKEFTETGAVEKTLPTDERTVRAAYAQEVLKQPVETLMVKPGPTGKAFESAHKPSEAKPKKEVAKKEIISKQATEPKQTLAAQPISRPAAEATLPQLVTQPQPESPPAAVKSLQPKESPAVHLPAPSPDAAGHRFYLEWDSPLEKAPSIGPKTADRFVAIGVKTVGQFITANAESMSKRLGQKHLDAVTLGEWQLQAKFCLQLPELRGHDAQLLVGAGVLAVDELTQIEPEFLLDQVLMFAQSSEGERALRGSPIPDLTEIQRWQQLAQQARPLKAA